jgi:ABC-type amino acid transport substrate-binding protein
MFEQDCQGIFRMLQALLLERKSIFLIAVFSYLCAPFTLQAKNLTCYSTELPPYVINKDNVISGIDVDIITEAGKRAGITVDFKLLPWVRLENELKKGIFSEVECAFSYGKNDARKAYMDFTNVPIKLTSYVLFAKKGSFSKQDGVNGLKGKRIGLRRGFIVPGDFEEMRKKNELVVEEIDSDEANFIKLEKGRIDGVITNFEVGYAILSAGQLEEFIAIELAIEKVPTYMVFNKEKKLTEQLTSFNKAIKEINSDGSSKKIRGKYIHLPSNSH